MTRYLTTEDLLVVINDLGVGPLRDVGLLEATASGRADLPDIAAMLRRWH